MLRSSSILIKAHIFMATLCTHVLHFTCESREVLTSSSSQPVSSLAMVACSFAFTACAIRSSCLCEVYLLVHSMSTRQSAPSPQRCPEKDFSISVGFLAKSTHQKPVGTILARASKHGRLFQPDSRTDRQTDRQTDTHTHTHTQTKVNSINHLSIKVF